MGYSIEDPPRRRELLRLTGRIAAYYPELMGTFLWAVAQSTKSLKVIKEARPSLEELAAFVDTIGPPASHILCTSRRGARLFYGGLPRFADREELLRCRIRAAQRIGLGIEDVLVPRPWPSRRRTSE